MAAREDVEARYRLLFERHWRRVRAYAGRRCFDRASAEDVVAEVFLIAWRRIEDIPLEHELAWLLKVAYHILSNANRGDARRGRLLARLQREGASGLVDDEPEAVSPEQAAVVRVRSAMERLRDQDAEILRLAAWEQLSHAEIAQVLECSTNAVGIRLHRARQRLAEVLEKDSDVLGH